MGYKLLHLEEFELIESRKEEKWIRKILFPIKAIQNTIALKIYNLPSYSIPLRFKNEKRRHEDVSLISLGEAIGFNTLEMANLLLYHDNQYEIYRKLRFVIYYIISTIFVVCIGTGFYFFYDEYRSLYESFKSTPLFILYLILIFSVYTLFCMVITRLFQKISFLASDSKYAGTLCVRTAICIIIQLNFDNVLSHNVH